MRTFIFLFVLTVIQITYHVDCEKEKQTQKPVIGSYKNRRKCPYFQQSACILTVLESVCDFHENPEDFVRQEKLHLLIQAEYCCCPEPFQECREQEKDEKCVEIFGQVMDETDHDNKTHVMTLKALNDVRQQLLELDENCVKYLWASEPVKCDTENEPPFKHHHHQCEQLYWVYEEIGIDNEDEMFESKCPFKRKYRADEEVTERMLHPLNDRDEIEEEAALTDTSPQLYQSASHENRRKCPYWQQSGCLLDELEKICEDTSPMSVLEGEENVFLCCCPKPYKACERSQADQNCLNTLDKYLGYKDTKQVDKYFMMHGVQAARNDLLSPDHACHVLANSVPFFRCSKKPAATPFTRHGVICEMLSWQWEELGDGNKEEFGKIGCPFIEKHRSPDGDARKGALGFVSDDQESYEVKTEL